MRFHFVFILLALFQSEAYAVTLVGKTPVNLLPPDGFSEVTNEMPALKEIISVLQRSDQKKKHIAYFIPNKHVDEALAGGIPNIDRYLVVGIDNRDIDYSAGPDDIPEFKMYIERDISSIISRQNTQFIIDHESLNTDLSSITKIQSSVNIHDVIPLQIHEDNDSQFSHSMILSADSKVAGLKIKSKMITATITVVNLSGKLLALNCYGTSEDLLWTRQTCSKWSNYLQKNN